MVTCFTELNENKDCRSVVLSGNGKGLTSGLLSNFSYNKF